MKNLITNKRLLDCDTIKMTHSCSAIMVKNSCGETERPGSINHPLHYQDAQIWKVIMWSRRYYQYDVIFHVSKYRIGCSYTHHNENIDGGLFNKENDGIVVICVGYGLPIDHFIGFYHPWL